MEKGRVDSRTFYAEYHGHPIEDLFIVEQALRETGRSIVWLMGDSSLDNKHWLYKNKFQAKEKCTMEDDSFCGNALNGMETVLFPTRSIKDVAYHVNVSLADLGLGDKYCALNCAVEESTVANRQDGKMMEHDAFVKNHVREHDMIIVSLGGNDVALAPSKATMMAIGSLNYLTPALLVKNGWGLGMGHLGTIFRDGVEDLLKRVTEETTPSLCICSTIYYPCEKGTGWADQMLDDMLGYTKSPSKLKCLIDACYDYFTSKITVPNCKMAYLHLGKVLDSQSEEDYDNRVEPSVQGGQKMGVAYAKLIKESLEQKEEEVEEVEEEGEGAGTPQKERKRKKQEKTSK